MTTTRFEAVLQLVAEYGLRLDRLEVEEWLDLFAEASVLDIDGHELRTREKRRGLTERAPRGLHVTNLPVLDGDLDADRVRSTATFYFWDHDGSTAVIGWYDDDLVWQDDRWKFERREIHYLGG